MMHFGYLLGSLGIGGGRGGQGQKSSLKQKWTHNPHLRAPSAENVFQRTASSLKPLYSRAGRREEIFGISHAIRYCQRASLTVNRLK